MIKLSISNIAFNKEDEERIYAYLSQNNIDLEIAPTIFVGSEPYNNLELASKKAKELKEKYNISISSMQSIWYGITENIFESKDSYEKLIAYTKKAIDFAKVVECPNIVFGCPKNRTLINDNDYETAIEFFKSIGMYAKEKDVVIAIEPNPVIYHTNFLNNTEEAIDFVKKINLSSIKVNYDLGTVIYNNENLNILKDNISYINHIHISEPNLVKIEKRNIHKELFKLLNELNYDKYLSIEMGKTNIENIEKIIDYVIKLNRESY